LTTGAFVQSQAKGVLTSVEDLNEVFDFYASDVQVEVKRQSAEVITRQVLVNPEPGQERALLYGFPLPADAQPNRLRWKVGGQWRSINIDLKTTWYGFPEHKYIPQYLEFFLGERPFMYVLPDSLGRYHRVEVELTYTQLLSFRNGKNLFRYPSDSREIRPGTLIPGKQNFHFRLITEREVKAFDMRGHSPVRSKSGSVYSLKYSEDSAASVSDYEVTYTLGTGKLRLDAYSSFLPDGELHCDQGPSGFLNLSFLPPHELNRPVVAKNITLVLDRSGSMEGSRKIEQAREAARVIVDRLNPQDRFNIVAFNEHIDTFKHELAPADLQHKRAARQFISGMKAEGSTDINAAISEALSMYSPSDNNDYNLILFLTDGQATTGVIDNNQILQNVDRLNHSGSARVSIFSFGIGHSSVDIPLLTKLALENGGIPEFLEDHEVEKAITDFYESIHQPVVLDPQLSFRPDVVQAVYPKPLPNLFLGRRLLVTGRYDSATTVQVTLTGRSTHGLVSHTFNLDLSDARHSRESFVPTVWAGRKRTHLLHRKLATPGIGHRRHFLDDSLEALDHCYHPRSSDFDESAFTASTEEIQKEASSTEDGLRFTPNPFTGETKMRLRLDRFTELNVRVYDQSGRLVRRMNQQGRPGLNTISWEGTNDAGRPLDAGLYLFELRTGGESHFGKVHKR
jgi:Ca-activated chloride channel family protein